MNKYIEIYKVGKNSKSIYFEKIQRKYSVLKHLFKTSYSINKLVSISFEDEKLSDFIVDTVFQDKQIVKCKNVKKATTIEELKDNLKKVKQTIKKHEEEIKNIIEIYNEHNKNSLKITYIKNFDIELEEIIYIRKSKRGFVIIGDKEFNVYVDSIYKILYEIIQEKGTFEFLDLYINDKLANVLKEHGLKNLKENISVREIEQDVIILKKQDDDKFIDKLLETSKMNIVEDMNELFRRILFKLDSFTLEFNVNSNMPKTQRIFRNIKELSLGQKVVALLSFILSYSEIANDHTPLVIDQPEDNLDSQYIYNNLVNQFRSVKEKRQIIIATHNSTIVVNSKTENVIVMNSDNNKGWVEESGYPTDKKIVNSILRYLEGGKESFKHKELIYKDYLNN